MPGTDLLIGWDQIEQYLLEFWNLAPCTIRKLHRHQLLETGHVLKRLKGRPPNRHWSVFTAKPLLDRWVILKYRTKHEIETKERPRLTRQVASYGQLRGK